MADNISITQGSGTTMATKEKGGVHTQRTYQSYDNLAGATREVGDLNPFPTRQRIGVGKTDSVPNGSTNGTALGTIPEGAIGAQFYLASGDALTFCIDNPAPSSAPANTVSISYAVHGPNWFEYLTGGQNVYITSRTGAPKFRWI